MMASFEAALPVEKWQEILANVSHEDLCNVMLTSRYMNSVASRPELWAGMRVNMEKVREKGLAHLYSINRFNKIKQMKFHASIDFNVAFIAATLTTAQCTKVLDAILSSTTLVHVIVFGVNLSEVPPDLLACAIKHLKTVDLSRTSLTTAQSIKILESILSSTTLVDVKLRGVNLSEVPPDLLACAIKHLKTVELCTNDLTTAQCTKVLEAILSSTTLVDVKLSSVNFSEVPPDLLANAIKHLKTVDLYLNHLTTVQCTKVLEAILSSTTLVHVKLNAVNLSEVPPDLLANAIKHLKTVDLCCTDLTTAQCTKVLEAILSSTTLVDVRLHHVDLRAGYDDQSVSVPMIGRKLLIGVHTKQIQQTANTERFRNFKIVTLFSAIWVNFTHFEKGIFNL